MDIMSAPIQTSPQIGLSFANHQDIDGYGETSGTSNATPRTAGIISFVLDSLRSEYMDYSSGASSIDRGFRKRYRW